MTRLGILARASGLVLAASLASGAVAQSDVSGIQTALAAARAKSEASRLQAERDHLELLRLQVEAGRAAEAELATRLSGAAEPVQAATRPAPPLSPPPALAVLASAGASAAPPEGQAVAGATTQDLAEAVVEEQTKQAQQNFGGLEFGVGISFTLDIGTSDRVNEAELVNGIVRVTDEDNGRARIMLESHYFFTPNASLFGVAHKNWGMGPFVALQPGTDDIIEAIALGGMIGFRRPGATTESFNIGVGVVIDPNTQVLGEGIIPNEPLPAGETEIRYKEEMQTGVLLLASFGF